MNVIIDPVNNEVVGFAPIGLTINPTFEFLPMPDGFEQDTLGVTRNSDTDEYDFYIDPIKLELKKQSIWSALRAQRNSLLSACDWTQLNDAQLSQDKKDEWTVYRQKLRDVPKSVQDPSDPVQWPLEPSAPPP